MWLELTSAKSQTSQLESPDNGTTNLPDRYFFSLRQFDFDFNMLLTRRLALSFPSFHVSRNYYPRVRYTILQSVSSSTTSLDMVPPVTQSSMSLALCIRDAHLFVIPERDQSLYDHPIYRSSSFNHLSLMQPREGSFVKSPKQRPPTSIPP